MYSAMTGTDSGRAVLGSSAEPDVFVAAEEAPFIEIGGPTGPVLSSRLAAAEGQRLSEPGRTFPRIVTPPPASPAVTHEPTTTPWLHVQFHDVLPQIPRTTVGLHPELIAYHFPEHPVSGEYRELRQAVSRQLPETTSRVLMFTAATTAAGTTTVVLNLAITLAREGLRVLVMDGNWHDPAVAAKLGIRPAPGLAEVLHGQLPLPWALQPTVVPTLQALAAGSVAEAEEVQHGELLRRDFSKLLTQLRQWFDWLLIDAGVWGVNPDRDATCRSADAVYLVTRADSTHRPEFTGLRTWVKQLGGALRGYVTTHIAAA
jgi:Mrp family chromosome partitioning ATPase